MDSHNKNFGSCENTILDLFHYNIPQPFRNIDYNYFSFWLLDTNWLSFTPWIHWIDKVRIDKWDLRQIEWAVSGGDNLAPGDAWLIVLAAIRTFIKDLPMNNIIYSSVSSHLPLPRGIYLLLLPSSATSRRESTHHHHLHYLLYTDRFMAVYPKQ